MITDEIDIKLVEQVANNYFQAPVFVERVKTGVSTYVYRVVYEGKSIYLRVLPENTSFAIEAKAHSTMLNLGVNVPIPIYLEHKNDLLGKSIMLTSEISGQCIDRIDRYDSDTADVLFTAGKQLAIINSIRVDGFSWINGDINDVFVGEKQNFYDYYYEKLHSDIDLLQDYGFNIGEIKTAVDKAYTILETDTAYLAHGDFDNSHIFYKDGCYTGIIDFGEIRGSHRLYDLGHYKLHDAIGGFSSLLEGYKSICAVTDEDVERIDYLALFVGLGRSKYQHYRNLIQKQLAVVSQYK